MEYLLVTLMVFVTATLLASATKLNIAYLFAPAIFVITFWEYFFGLIGFLNFGMETFVLLITFTTVTLLIRYKNFRSSTTRDLFSPSSLAFFILSAISFIKTKDWLLFQWDEFTHWGHVVRIMYEYGALGPGTPTEYTSEAYPPALALFQYFVIDFSSGWREGLLFWSIHLIAMSIIVSVLAKCSFRNFPEILLKLFVSLVAMSAFVNIFDNIYADPTLAITFGFLIFVAIKTPSLDNGWGFVFATTAGFLTMIKPTGIYFACAAILINIISTLFMLKFNSGRRTLLSLRPALTALIAVGTAWMSWGYYLASLNSSGYSPIGSVPPLSNSGGREQFVADVSSKFIRALFNTGLNPISYSNMSAFKWTIVCIAFFAIWMSLNGMGTILRNLAIGITLLVTSAGYLYVILNAYLTLFGPGEAAALASFSRYIATWYQGVIFVIVLLILSEFDLTKSQDSIFRDKEIYKSPTKKQIGVLLIGFMALSTVSSVENYVNLIKSSQVMGLGTRALFDSMVKAIEAARMPEGSKVYIITQHKFGFEYYVLRYEMIGKQFGVMPFSIGSKNGDADIWTEPTMDAKRWSKTLRDFDYVVLYITTESFNKEFSSLFEGGVVEPNSVYKVQKSKDKVLLSKVE